MTLVDTASDPALTGLWGWQGRVLIEARSTLSEHGSAVIVVPTGGGKCLAPETPVLLHNGLVKQAREIEVGDVLMGPDSLPRRVLSTMSDHGPMVEIVPVKGRPWRCNDVHVLTLARTPQRASPRFASQGSAVIDIPVDEYVGKSKTFKHRHKLFRVGVEWPERRQPLDPYFVGLLLGDGDVTRGRVAVTTTDPEIVAECEAQAKRWGMDVRRDAHDDRTPTYHLSRGWSGGKPNPITGHLRDLNIAGCTALTKYVPWVYRTASRDQRLELLAGLMDTDGHLTDHGVFDFVSKSPALAHDVAFVARSVGLAVTESDKIVNGDTYHRLCISGDVAMIPCRLPRKQAKPRRQIKNPLRTGFDVRPVGDGPYCGFELDSDGRFLLGDFTVTHNTVIAGGITRGAHARGRRVLFVVHRYELVEQVLETLEKALPDIEVGVEARGYPPQPWATLQVGMVTTLVNRDWVHPPDIVIVDEAHHARAKTWEKVLARWPHAILLGLTATPERLDGKGLGQHFKALVNGPTIPELVAGDDEGKYLAPIRTLTIPVGLDLRGLAKNRRGEYRDQASRLNERVFVGAADAYQRYANGRSAIFFGVNRDHSRHVADELRARGIAAEHVDGTDPMGRRKRIMNEFRTGGVQVVCNCDLVCLDEQTEILTRSGWRGIDTIQKTDLAANWHPPSGEITFGPIRQLIRRDRTATDAMVQYTSSRSVDFRVTGNHRMAVYDHGCFAERRAAEIVGQRLRVPVSGFAQPDQIEPAAEPPRKTGVAARIRAVSYHLRRKGMTTSAARAEAQCRVERRDSLRYRSPSHMTLDECRFVGFWLGDGSRARLHTGGVEYRLFQSTRYPEIIEWVERVIDGCGFDSIRRQKPYGSGRHEMVSWSLPRGTGFGAQQRNGVYAVEPFLDKTGTDLLWGLDREQFLALWDGLNYADGLHSVGTSRVTNTSLPLLELLQAVATCRGLHARLVEVDASGASFAATKPQYRLSLQDRSRVEIGAGRTQVETETLWVPERVWCINNDTTWIVTRRRGSVVIVGNSEGFDAPSCEVVIMGGHTNSVTQYLQRAGRAMRYLPGKVALAIDLAGTVADLGLPDEVREWTLEDGFVEPKRRKAREVQVCDECHTAFYGQFCPVCQTEASTLVVTEVDVELEEASAGPKARTRRRSTLQSAVASARYAPNPRAALERARKTEMDRPGGKYVPPEWVDSILRAWGVG